MSIAPNQRVFIVDDEVVIASTLARILRSQGIDTTSFSEPLKALEAARSQAPSLIISDMSMPEMSGMDMAVQMREECPDCKVLLMTGQGSSREMLDYAKDHGHRFCIMAKPVYPSELLRRVEGMIGVQRPLVTRYFGEAS